MAKKQEGELIDIGAAAAPAPELQDQELSELDALLRDLDTTAGVRWLIYAMPGKGTWSRKTFCDALDVDTYPTLDALLVKIRDTWGGGEFKLLLRDAKTLLRNVTVTIAPTSKAAAPAEPASGPGGMAQLVDAMNNGFARMADLMRAPPAPAADPFDVLTKAVKLVQSMQPPQNNAPAASTSELVAMFRDVLSIRQQLKEETENTEGGATGMDVIRDLVRQVPAFLRGQGMASMMQMPPAGPPQPGINDNAPPAASSMPAVPPGLPPAVVPEFQILLHAAKNNRDPESYVNVLLDAMPQGADGQDLAQLQPFLEQFARQAPEIAQYREWIERLVSAAVYDLTGDQPPPEDGASMNGGADASFRASQQP